MSKLGGPPNWGMVGRLKPPLDFYKWKGIWCVRYYPEHIKQPGTEAQKATWCAMLATVDDWNTQGNIDKVAWKTLVRNANRTGRDFHGRLHLKDQISGSKPWTIFLLESVRWRGDDVKIWFTANNFAVPKLNWCYDDDNRRAYWWFDVGYCIRGRKWTRKFNLYENWKESYSWTFPNFDKRYNKTILTPSSTKQIYFTIVLNPVQIGSYRGRSGVYVFRKGVNYP